MATLTDANHQPVGMQSGIATRLEGDSAETVTVFTTRKGVLQSEGFKAGRYRVEIAVDKFEPFEIEVPKDAKEEYNAGTVVLKERKGN